MNIAHNHHDSNVIPKLFLKIVNHIINDEQSNSSELLRKHQYASIKKMSCSQI